MSREGGYGRIDSLKNSLNTEQYQRTGLGNAVRFNAAMNLAADTLGAEIDGTLDESTGLFQGLAGRVTQSEFVRALDDDLESMRDEFDNIREEELGLVDDRFDTEETIQQRLANGAYRSRLGRSVARATVESLGQYHDANSPFNSGATGAFRAFTNGFVQDDEDAFGSRVLYDNVFGQYEDGGESLTMQRRRTITDPTNNMNRTVGDKILDDVVNRSIYDQNEIITRVDTEFARFHGESMIDQMSMTGSGLKAARQTIREVMLDSSAYGRQIADRGESGTHPVDFAQAMINRVGEENISAEISEVQNSLTLLDNNLKNRSGQSAGTDGGYVNKAGVAQFIDLINTAGTRSDSGELIGGQISISSFQFQNETISAALTDKIQRHVLETVLQGGTGKPLQVDLVLAYPRQRALNQKNSEDTRYGIGATNYSILGPNLIEAMKLEEVKNDVFDMLRGLGVAEDNLQQYLNVNIQFRDKKFHPKVYLTDNVAGIGTQNLTGPVGNSVNQAGSNFETMRFVANKYKDDTQLEKARSEFVPLSNDDIRENADNALKNGDVTQSLLYRQIVNAVEYEKNFVSQAGIDRAGGSTATPIINSRRGNQVGFAGDIYEHLRNTLDYAYETNFNIVNGSQKGSIRKEVAGRNTTHMFMVLDQAFILQMGSDGFSKQLKGEMGSEVGSPFGEKDEAVVQYRQQQNKLFDLLIANKASVVVDAKNYQEQVMNPLIKKINKNQALKDNFERHGKSLGLMAGYDLFDPGAAATPEEYSLSMKAMRKELVRMGFTKEAGFDDTDLKQIIGLASGNIEMAKAPRQHVKSFGLMDYRQGGSPELVSYYMGSSNLGLYSLGIPTGDNGGFKSTDGDLTNTEMGIMLGRRDMADGTNLSRVQDHSSRMSKGSLSDPTDINGIERVDESAIDQWSLTQEEERYELMLAQRHLVQTWSQLGNSRMENPNFKSVNTKPLWQSNINTGDLEILKNRLETMARDLGIDPGASRSAFQIVERYGGTSGSGATSINVTIDIAQMLGSSGFLAGSAKLPKLNFELTVLQGPSRGSGMFNDRTDDGNVPGFVYFVDKNKVVGNGIFSNDSGKSIEVLGRKNYDDDFISNTKEGGRITLQSGESAEMTSLDIVPQLFATLIGEGVKRFGANASKDALHDMTNEKRRETMIDFLSKALSGRGDQFDEKSNSIFTARELLLQDLNDTNIHYLTGLVGTLSTSEESRADFREGGQDERTRLSERALTLKAVSKFKGEVHELFQRRTREGVAITDADLNQIVDSLSSLVFGGTLGEGESHDGSTQLANQIMKISGRDPEEALKVQEFKEFQTLMFGSFLQSRDDRTYGGQQGFYRTLLMGVGDSTVDRKTANLMFNLDEDNQGLHNLGAYARFKPLEYTPTTDIHQVMYRSVASKSTSMTKNDPGLDSMMFESEARDLGDAANLRLMSSIGIGTVMHRDNYILKDSDGNVMVGKHQQEIFDAMEAAGVDKNALAIARQEYVRAASAQFGDLNSNERGDTVRLQFYTGSAKKLSQLPQRIKNAMGARPMYQYSVEAQMALAEGESINELTNSYIKRNRDPLKSSIKAKVIELQDRLETIIKSNGTEEQIAKVSKQLDDLKVIGSKAFTTETDGLGAVFSGQIKSVLNQEQISFIENTRSRLYEAMEELIAEGEVSDEQFNELLRVEVMKAGLVNKGLGKMIAGSNHMNYSMSIIQLTGTYNDTFLANSLYGTTYKSKEAYDIIRSNDTDIYSLNQDQLKAAGVLNVGMTEGYFDTQQKSVKGSMMGEGGMEVLLQKGDVIVEDPETGYYVQKRKVNNKWVIVNSVDSNRNLSTIGNIIDNTGFSDVGSPTLGAAPTTSYGRRGEESVDYIYSAESRPGNFANNEYLLQFDRLRSIKAGSGRRVEGTDSSSLVKGVAFFAGRIRKEYNGQEHTLNVFEDLERQYMENYAVGEVGGSLKAYLDNSDTTQMVTLADGRQVHAPLSSSIQGVFNANNFKSFFWSHGATILKAQTETPEGQSHFMLDELFSTNSQHNVTNAKKLAGALLLNFGTEFISVNSTDVETKNTEVNKVKRALVEGMIKGEYGAYHQKLAMATGLQLRTSEINSINNRVDKNGENRAEITSQLLFDKMAKNSGYNGLTLGGIAGISSDQLMAVLSGDANEATKLLERVRKGMLDPVARSASTTGGINFDNHTHRGAAIVTTAVDLMHQLSRSGSNLQLPSDIDMNSEKIKEVLYNVMGLGGEVDDEFREDILQFIGSMNTDVNAVTVFTDITFSFSKDPVGTQSVGRHEAQHLITPFTGNLEKYREGGQLDKIQHTVAGLQALVSGKKSGLVFYDQMARSGFAQKNALNLASADTDFMFTTFHKEKFLGFYQQGTSGIATDNFVKSYKEINRELARDDSKYNWDTFQVTRDIGDATQISYVRQAGQRISDMTSVNEAIEVINKHIDQFYPGVDPTERARLQDKFLRMGGQGFALHQMDELVNQMSINNARFQADPRKTKGKDTTKQFLNNMQNKQMFVSIPDLEFSQQNGEILARTDRQNTISTIIPSADDMRALGAQYADFVDPILGHYKSLSAIFVPGTEENRVFEKVRLATQNNEPIFLSTAEFKVYKSIQDSAILMPTELSKGIANARTQEAFAGKNKYQGFTSTGIGSMLMPFGSAALSQAKLDEAGMRNNKARVEAVKESDLKIQQMNQRLQRRFTDEERIYIALEDKFGAPGKHNNGDFQRALQTSVHFSQEIKMKGLGTLQSTMGTLNRLRKEGLAAQRHDVSRKAQAGNMVSTLNELQRLHDQLDRIKGSELETESTRQVIGQLQDEVVQYRNLVLDEGKKNFGLQAYTAGEAMAAGGPDWLKEKQLGIYDSDSNYVTLDSQEGKTLGVYAVYDDVSQKIVPGGSFVGEDALPVVHIHKETVMGFVYEEEGEEIVLQRAGFQATYGTKGLTSYQQLTTSTADRATQRPFDIHTAKNPRQTHTAEITERSKASKIQNLVMEEMSALYPDDLRQEKRIERDIIGKIEDRVEATEDRNKLGTISDYLTNFVDRRSDIDVDRVIDLQERIAFKKSYFDEGEMFGPKLPSPVLSTIDEDPRADLTRDVKNPAAWETVNDRRGGIIQEMRAGTFERSGRMINSGFESIDKKLGNIRNLASDKMTYTKADGKVVTRKSYGEGLTDPISLNISRARQQFEGSVSKLQEATEEFERIKASTPKEDRKDAKGAFQGAKRKVQREVEKTYTENAMQLASLYQNIEGRINDLDNMSEAQRVAYNLSEDKVAVIRGELTGILSEIESQLSMVNAKVIKIEKGDQINYAYMQPQNQAGKDAVVSRSLGSAFTMSWGGKEMVLAESKVFIEAAPEMQGPPKPPKPPSKVISAAAEPPEEPSKKITNPPLSDPSVTAVRHESNARRVVNETYRTRYAAEPRVVQEHNSLVANLKSFHRKQKAAIALGISSNLESEFDVMKREAIKTKNMIAEYRDSNFLTEDEKRAAFTELKGKLMEKRNQAYAMANISPETGKEIGINPETGEALENRPGFDQRRPSLNDSYIYHAQALNYDQLLTHLSLLGNATGVEELSKEHVKDLQRRSTFIRKYGSFALNSYEDGDGKSTFFGLGHQEIGFDTKALFVIENTTPDAGSAQRHMKAINQITEEATKLGMTEASKTMASQYATQQIDAQIAMYENRAEEMRKFSEEREAHSARRDSDGNLVIDEATNKKISAAHRDYETNTKQIVDFLHSQKAKINNGATKPGQIRTIFEDIDTMVAATDRANLQMAEVFRPPTPGGTDPRLHTYRVMQGVMALNQVSNMLQDTAADGTGMTGQNTKMIYSTERGQTATVMSALGIVTYGGGDWDGDSYTAIFHQAEEIQSAIQKHKGKKNESELLMKGAMKEAETVRQELKAMNPSDKNFNKKAERLQQLEATVEERRAQVARSNQDFESAKADMELKIQSGYRGLTARARQQISNYTGIDERHFVSSEEVMYDVNGNVVKDDNGQAVTGLRQGATQDADALFVYMEQGYQLMEGIDSKRNQVIGMMNNIDALTGYRTNPQAFDEDGWLKQLSTGITLDIHTKKVSSESPGIAMLKDRASSVLNENQNLNEDQRAFLNTLANADDDTSRAWLEEFGKLTKEMGMQDADEATHSRNQVAYIKDAKERRARMNRWIANDLFNPMLANETVGKFMQQGMGMNLTEGTFDMTLKILGKAGGEVLGKTYNTIIGSTFQDAPVMTYGTQIMDEKSDLYHATMTEFQKQAERRFETHEMSQDKALLYEDGKEKGLSGKKLDNYVATQIRKVGYDEFRSYRDQTIAAVEKSGDVQGFMKNIHQLMRDSIKLKGDTSTLQDELDILSKDYDDLSKKMSDTDDEGARSELRNQRDRIIEGMASKLGPGPGLKSLIDLDYLTNESDKTGLTRTDFENRFFEGSIEDNRERLLSMGASMNLSSSEMDELRGIKSGTRNDETAALLKVARGQTARNLGAMVTSYQMARVAGDGRSQQVKELANTQRAKLATQIEAHAVPGMPLNRTANGQIDVSDVIDNKYTRVIEREHEGAKFDANRQHKEALGAHLGLKESQIFDDNGQITQQYTDELREAANKMGVTQDEYLLAYDHILENNREVIGGIFGNDGEKMGQFTTMNMMRKNVAQSMLTGQTPSSEGAKVINESIGGEVITTMAQLAAQGKLDSQGMEVFSGMYKGVMRHLIEATGQEIQVFNKQTGKMESRQYNDLDDKSKNAVMTKMMYENMFGTQVSNQKGFTRATSEQSRDFKASTGQFIADSVLELREDGTLGNDFIDALDKAGEGSSTKAQKDMFEAMGEEYLRETLNSEEMTEMVLKQYLNADGVDPNSDKAKMYRRQIATSTKAQMKRRQEQITNSTALSRSKHSRGYGVQSRSSFMNNMNSDVIGQLSKDSRANALDLVMPLLLTAAGTAISEGSIGGDELMALSGAAFTSFQYARTGTIDHADLSARESKKRLAAAQATSGIFKLKNAMMQHGEENMGTAIAQVAVSEAVSVGFNMVATPWLSKNIAEKGFGAGAAPAMNALDMRKFQAGHQLAGNVAASAISAVSSTLISGLLMNTMQGQGPSLSETIQSFLPAAQAVSQVNEAIARRRAQEAAFEDFQAETDGTDDTIQEYMVVTDATYNPDDYSSIADLSAAQEVEPGSDGSLSVGILG